MRDPAPPTQAVTPTPVPTPEERLGARVDQLLARMTREQKVGQLMMVGFSGTEADESVEALVRGREVGGVCLFKRNIESPEQVARLNWDLRLMMSDAIPPFIAVDQEGGNVVRVDEGAIVLPGNMALGATHRRELAYLAARAQAQDLLRLGFNMNFAPVLDVNVNPKNPVIGIRSFGDQPKIVAELGADFVRGQQEQNLITVAKHFPGHGNTDADSHRSLPVMKESAEEVMAQLEPFVAAISQGLDALMTAHVAVRSLTGSDEPATVSPEILQTLLRDKLGFEGVVITDELEMEAVARRGVGETAVKAINAGADMVLVPWRAEKKLEVYQALLGAVRSGRIPADRLESAVRRILTTKLKRGLFEPPDPLPPRIASLRSRRADDPVAKEIARSSVTLVRTDPQALPIDPSKRIAVITAESALAEAVKRRAPNARALVVPAYPPNGRRAGLRAAAQRLARSADVVVVGVINSRQLELVTMAAATGTPVLVVSMGLPYLVENVDEARAVLAVYSYRDVSAEAAVAALFGEQGTPGKLPVDLRRFRVGHGLTTADAEPRR